MPDLEKVAGVEPFVDMHQQREAAELCMWTFLATEILFFGGLFFAYATYRHAYPEGFAAGAAETDVLFGTINTLLLLTSSLTMALAVGAAEHNHRRAIIRYLATTLFFGLAFLGIKAVEYHDDFTRALVPGPNFTSDLPPSAELFFVLYWAMTGLHALHVIVGLGIITVIAWHARNGRYTASYFHPVEIAGLYWHFVDVVWIFLYPLLYLIDLQK
jgi:cytochrome c oxidase subunit 3